MNADRAGRGEGETITLKRCCFVLLQPHWPAIQRTWSEEANTARAPGETWNCGSPRNQAWTLSCTGWMKTWPPQPTASTKSLSATWRACPPTPPTPSLCTSCPALTLWLVSPFLSPHLSCPSRKGGNSLSEEPENKVVYSCLREITFSGKTGLNCCFLTSIFSPSKLPFLACFLPRWSVILSFFEFLDVHCCDQKMCNNETERSRELYISILEEQVQPHQCDIKSVIVSCQKKAW